MCPFCADFDQVLSAVTPPRYSPSHSQQNPGQIPLFVLCCPTFDLTDLGDGQDQERSSSAGLNDDRQELWVDGAEGAVPRHLGDADVIVGLLGLNCLAEDVAKLALSHNAATHGCRKGGGGGGGVIVA